MGGVPRGTVTCKCGAEFEPETPRDVECNRCFNHGYLAPQWPVGVGWRLILLELHAHLTQIVPDYRIAQVKEKFGGLRYYIGSIPEGVFRESYDLIDEAEQRSYETCEWCGKPGRENIKRGWVKTLCDACAAQRT